MIRTRQYSVAVLRAKGGTENVSRHVAFHPRNGEIAQADYPALGGRRISTNSKVMDS